MTFKTSYLPSLSHTKWSGWKAENYVIEYTIKMVYKCSLLNSGQSFYVDNWFFFLTSY